MATRPIGMVINARNDWHMASATLFGEVRRGGRIGCTASLLAACLLPWRVRRKNGRLGVVNFVVSPARKASVECAVSSRRHRFLV